MIYTLSRYTYNSVVADDGIVTAERKESYNVAVYKYHVVPGDTFESIAASIYGDAGQYWRIADLNPQIKFPLDLAPGDVIRVPQ
jgi:nucleoid-associated protein YgaU